MKHRMDNLHPGIRISVSGYLLDGFGKKRAGPELFTEGVPKPARFVAADW